MKTFASVLSSILVCLAQTALAQDTVPPPPPGYEGASGNAVVVVDANAGPQHHRPAAERVPTRSGFTLELGLGPGHLSIPDADFSEFGVAGLSLSLGGFLNPDLALMFRVAGVTITGVDASLTYAQTLCALQWSPTDRLMISGGIGVAFVSLRFAGSPFTTAARSPTGFALNARIGYAVAQWAHHTLRISYELMPASIDSTFVVGQGIAIEWQWH